MGFIREPEGIYFTIRSKPLTPEVEKALSQYITQRNLEIKMNRIKPYFRTSK